MAQNDIEFACRTKSMKQMSCGAALAVFATAGVLVFLSVYSTQLAIAKDTTGLSDRLTQQQRNWVRGLRSRNGISCCDDADGIDPVWDIHGTEYRVHYNGEWLVVGPDALLTERNELGVARAWMGKINDRPYVRCFLPGPTT